MRPTVVIFTLAITFLAGFWGSFQFLVVEDFL